MTEVDFLTALGRLLRDAHLREAFAQDAAFVAHQLGVAAPDRSAFERMQPAELEAQARVLIRKRFRAVCARLPLTCAELEEGGWPRFAESPGKIGPRPNRLTRSLFANG